MSYVEMAYFKKYTGNALCYTINDFYLEYKKEYKKQNPFGEMLDKKTFVSALTDYLELIMKNIVISCEPFKMPKGLGTITIQQFENKIPGNQIREYRLKRYKNYNDELNDKVMFYARSDKKKYYKWQWKKNVRLIPPYGSLYSFRENRDMKNFLYDHIYECTNDPKRKDFEFKVKDKIQRCNMIAPETILMDK